MSSLLIVLAVLGALATLSDARGNLFLGDKTGGVLIYHEIHDKFGIPFMRRDEEVAVHGIGNEKIKAVIVQDLKGDGISYIISGGVKYSSVVIQLVSSRGEGYRFMVDVYAHIPEPVTTTPTPDLLAGNATDVPSVGSIV